MEEAYFESKTGLSAAGEHCSERLGALPVPH